MLFEKYKSTAILLACFLCSIFLVTLLQVYSVKMNENANSFVRLTPPHIIDTYKDLVLGKKGFYIIGINRNKVLLGNYFDPAKLFLTDSSLSEIKKYPLNIGSFELTESSNVHLSLDSPYFYLNNFTTGAILRGSISNPSDKLTVLDTANISTSIFLPYCGNKFAVRTFIPRLNKNVLGRLTTNQSSIFLSPEVLEPQIDGVFSTDGMLRFDPSSSTFVYTYFYRNQFICLNDQLMILYRGHTLDTNVHAKIKVRKIDENKSTLSSPGFNVNRESCINKNWIFINSDMKADNDSEQVSRDYAAIDVYNLKDGKYHFSFYLLKKVGNISSMVMAGNTIYTIQETTLCANTLNFNSIKM
jgi:hypothetical protein